MQLFYAPDIVLPHYTLSEEESKHCVRVLRLASGDELHLTDGRGNLYRCRVTDPNPKHCTVEAVETIAEYGKMPYGITLAVAPTRTSNASNGSSKRPPKWASPASCPSSATAANDAS